MKQYIVITQHVIGWDTEYVWDRCRWPTHERAVEHGFTLGRSDDFNVGVIEDGRLTWFGWMDRPLNSDRDKIGKAIGLGPVVEDAS